MIDASVAVKWVYDEPGAREARDLFSTQPNLTAPVVWGIETASALAKKQHQGYLSPQEVRGRLDYLAALPITLVDDDVLLPEALSLSFELRHPVRLPVSRLGASRGLQCADRRSTVPEGRRALRIQRFDGADRPGSPVALQGPHFQRAGL